MKIQEKGEMLKDTFTLRLAPFGKTVFPFLAGQYVYMKNPLFRPNDAHPFSIASSPKESDFLEFCVKIYGDWTKNLSLLEAPSTLYLSQPQGSFFWDETIEHAAFLLGGIGISPIMSMLRTLLQTEKKPRSITILYGNRTPETIAYKGDLEMLANILPLKIVHIFSHISPAHPWKGYRGFITQEIIEQEIDLKRDPSFFVIGPPIFIQKMNTILSLMQIPSQRIRQELLT